MLARTGLIAGLLLGLDASSAAATAAGAGEGCRADQEAASLLQARKHPHQHHHSKGKHLKDKPASAEEIAKADCLECGAGRFHTVSGYAGTVADIHVSGYIHMVAVTGKTPAHHRQILTYHASGVDPRCATGPEGTGASCGVYIVESTSCDDIGGDVKPYYNESVVQDPWTARVSYIAEQHADTAKTYACSSGTSVKTGLLPQAVPGQAVVLFDFDGHPMGCAVVGEGTPTKRPKEETPEEHALEIGADAHALAAKHFSKYRDYAGDLTVSGTVYMTEAPSKCPRTPSQYLDYRLYGLDPSCRHGPGPLNPAFSCGIVVYSGTCEEKLAPYWNSTAVKQAPWAFRPSYTTFKEGHAADARVKMVTGYKLQEFTGKPLVVYNYAGQEVACGVLEAFLE